MDPSNNGVQLHLKCYAPKESGGDGINLPLH